MCDRLFIYLNTSKTSKGNYVEGDTRNVYRVAQWCKKRTTNITTKKLFMPWGLNRVVVKINLEKKKRYRHSLRILLSGRRKASTHNSSMSPALSLSPLQDTLISSKHCSSKSLKQSNQSFNKVRNCAEYYAGYCIYEIYRRGMDMSVVFILPLSEAEDAWTSAGRCCFVPGHILYTAFGRLRCAAHRLT